MKPITIHRLKVAGRGPARILLAALLLVACGKDTYDQPGYFVEYTIDNLSHHDIIIESSPAGSGSVTTNYLGTRARLTIHYVSGSDLTTRQYMDGLEALPFDLLDIHSEDGKMLLYDPTDLEKWQKLTAYGTARIQLMIKVDDFED